MFPDAPLPLGEVLGALKVRFWTWDLATDVVTTRIFHHSPTVELFDDWRERVHPDDRVRVEGAMRDAILSRTYYQAQFRMREGDGEGKLRWKLATGFCLYDERTGRALRMIGAVVDTTASREAELLRRESEDRITAILNHTPAVVFVKDRAGRYLFANQPLLQILGWSLETVLGKVDAELFEEDIWRKLHANDERVLRGETLHIEEQVRQADGIHTYISVKFPLRAADGSVDRVCGISTDITAQKRSEEALNRALAELNRSNGELLQFASAVSHDLKEPLRVVVTALRQLERDGGREAAASAGQHVQAALTNALRMGEMIDEMLLSAHAGRQRRQAKRVDCEKVVDDVLRLLASAIEETGARVALGELPEVAGDEVGIGQIFQNLLSNALKFRRGRPRIEIAAEPGTNEGWWRFRVRDNGIGIPAEHFQRIFEPFHRLHDRQEYPGSGIGLATCRTVLERHGGRIWVESAPDEGTTFFFTLPAVKGARPAPDQRADDGLEIGKPL